MAEPASAPKLDFDHFYTYSEVEAFCRRLAETHPSLCRLDAIGRTPEGRDIHLVTVTDFDSGDPDGRPGYLVHGGIHAHEPASTHAPLYTAQRLLDDHTVGGILTRVAFYLIPRICPDATEFCVATTMRIRSRTDFANKAPNTVYPSDLDADGKILSMRQEHPDGTYVPDPEEPRLLIDRRPNSPGPYYRVFPEGLIHDWDGGDRIRIGGLHSFYPGNPDIHAGRSFDFNRNWSYDWQPEHDQRGAGDYPFSEPEMRHLAQFIFAHPKIFGMVGYHCGHASIIRGPSWGTREEMDEGDDLVMEEIAQMASEETGFPAVTLTQMGPPNRRVKGKRGHSHGFMYNHLGIFGYEIELGTVTNNAGLKTEDYLRFKGPAEIDAWNRRLLQWWDQRSQREPLFEPWRAFDHPQVGLVELGGLLSTVIDNPLVSELQPTIEASYRFTVRHAELHPAVRIEDLHVDGFGEVFRVRTRIANRGALPTNITNLGRTLHRVPKVSVRFTPAEGAELLSEAGHLELGHLPKMVGSRLVEWFVRMPTARAGSSAATGDALGVITLNGGTGADQIISVKHA